MRIKRITAGIAAAGIAVTAFALPAHAATVPVNWHQRTCTAFGRWQAHPTTARLDTLAADSFHVPWRYLGADVWGMYSDVRSGSVKYVHSDVRYVAEDCSN